ncbi:MAG: exosortase-associated EpsI family protein [Rhodobacteraceae bacterium]|nr:exosortase-associated EpsI family protein [Paracoccaceae bacterium]
MTFAASSARRALRYGPTCPVVVATAVKITSAAFRVRMYAGFPPLPKTRRFVAAVVTFSIAATATLLARLQTSRTLGEPGLRLIAQEVLDDSGRVINTNTVPLPDSALDYESTIVPITVGEANALPKDTTYARRLYKAPDQFQILASIVMMGTDRTSIHRPQICLPAQGWAVEREEVVTVPLTQPTRYELPVMKMVGKKTITGRDGQPAELKAVYAYWFVADGQLTASHNQRQWWSMVETASTGTLQRWAYVSLFAIAPPGLEDKAFERMVQFIQDTVPKFQIAPARAN